MNGDYESNFTVLVRHYKWAAHLQNTSKIPDLLTGSGADITLLYVRSTQLHTRSIGWHKCFDFIKHSSQFRRRSTNILDYIKVLPGTTSCYVSTTDFLTLQIYYKLQKAQWPDEYSVRTLNRKIHLKCELRVRLKLYKPQCCFILNIQLIAQCFIIKIH